MENIDKIKTKLTKRLRCPCCRSKVEVNFYDTGQPSLHSVHISCNSCDYTMQTIVGDFQDIYLETLCDWNYFCDRAKLNKKNKENNE